MTEPVPAIGVLVALLLVDPVTQGLADAGLLAEPTPVLRSAGEDLSIALDKGLSAGIQRIGVI
jgi:hypothetical protein